MLTAGIDIGSITTKVAVLDGRNILGTDLGFTGYNPDKSWREVYTRTLERLGLQESAISRIVSTGYGRQKVGIATKKITEIVCHAEGARHFLPAVRAVMTLGA